MPKTYSEIMMIGKSLDVSLMVEWISCIEEATRMHSVNQNWFLQRAGRMTVSKFKLVCKTDKIKPSLSLIKSVCYPTKVSFITNETLWGISHENKAVEEYKKNMEEEYHEFFQVNDVWLIINRKWPQLGASQDRPIYCECCLGDWLSGNKITLSIT